MINRVIKNCRRSKILKLRWKIFLACTLLVSISSCSQKKDSKKDSDTGVAQSVKTTKVQSRPMERTVTVTGSFLAREQATLTVKSPGRLQTVAVDVGSVAK